MRKIIPLVVAGATALTVGGGALAYAGLDHHVTLSVDGRPSLVSTTDHTVGDLLASQGITVGLHDVVAPAAGTALTDGTLVAVQYGRQVTFTIDGAPQTIWTTATDVEQAVGALGLDTTGATLSTSRSATIGRQGLSVDVAMVKHVVITAAGHRRTLTTTAQTVAQALTVAKIAVDADDELSVPARTRLTDGATIRYTRVDVTTATKRSRVEHDVVRKTSAKLAEGTTKVDTAGVDGSRTTTYRVVEHDGRVTKRTEIDSTVTKKAVTEVVVVGTKTPTTSSDGGSGSISSSRWDKIAQCESGGNWSINTGNGYYGGLQFSLATWRSQGGTGLPSDASKAEQIRIATKLQKAAGWGQWSCA